MASFAQRFAGWKTESPLFYFRGLQSFAPQKDKLFYPTSRMAQQSLSKAQRTLLKKEAIRALQNAYAPYSKFRVGAALLTTSGRVFLGCNVENASYGMTNCAERTAIFSAIASTGPKMRIRAVAVANDSDVPCSPCGACRQVIYEFGPDAIILFPGKRGWKEARIKQLLPEGFSLE